MAFTAAQRRIIATLAIAGALVAAPAIASAPAQEPDISGVWNRYPPYPGTFSGQPDPAELQVVPPPLRAPYLAQWQAMEQRRAAADAAGKPLPTPSSQCLPEGVPGIMGAHYALQILQNPALRQVTVLAEFRSQVRRIYLDEALPPVEAINPGYFGRSVGRWEGGVLVVETAGVREDVRYEDIPHSPAMHVEERMHLRADGILADDVTITDPQYLTAPYRFTFLYKREPASYRIEEYVCDGDRTVVGTDGSLEMKTEPTP